MNRFKFGKWFSTFDFSQEFNCKSQKEKWNVALHDPAYLIFCLILLGLCMLLVISNFN